MIQIKLKLPLIYKLLACIFCSFFFFKGRLGSDDLEVFNFIFNYFHSDNSLSSYIESIKTESSQKIFYNSIQEHSYFTFYHRFVWVVQTYLITSFIKIFSIFSFDVYFFSQYFSGFILSFYTCVSFFLCQNFFNKKTTKINSYFLTISIFFGSGLICFFTGAFIECLVILLLILRVTQNNKYKYFLDFLIIFIKPFYFLLVCGLVFSENKIFNSKKFKTLSINFENLKIVLLYIFGLLSLFLFIRYILFDAPSYTNYLTNFFGRELNYYIYLNQLFDFIFSFGSGLFFSLPIIIILIIYGWQGYESLSKMFFSVVLIFFLSLFNQHHGQAVGGRFFLPTLFIFMKEFLSGFLFLKKKIYVLAFIAVITILNLPSIEYRNFNLFQYINQSQIKAKPAESNYDTWNFPLRDFRFNHLVFANNIILKKIKSIDTIYIRDLKFNTEDVYPMTPIKRISYLNKYKIDKYDNKLILLLKSYSNYLVGIYYFFILIFLSLYLFFFFKIISKIDLKKIKN
jgi:hypothetical protein